MYEKIFAIFNLITILDSKSVTLKIKEKDDSSFRLISLTTPTISSLHTIIKNRLKKEGISIRTVTLLPDVLIESEYEDFKSFEFC